MGNNNENQQEGLSQNRWNEDLQKRGEDLNGEGDDYKGEGHREKNQVGFSQRTDRSKSSVDQTANLRDNYDDDRGNYGRGGYSGNTYREGTSGGESDRSSERQSGTERPGEYRDQQGIHKGKGPGGYQRSDQRIYDDVNDRLAEDAFIDASDIEVKVANAEVTLMGSVENRDAKRRAEDIAESVSGVKNVENLLKVKGNRDWTNRDGNAESRSKDTKRGAINQER